MKASLDRFGIMCLWAENETELYALRQWWNNGDKGSDVCFKVNLEEIPSDYGERLPYQRSWRVRNVNDKTNNSDNFSER